MQLRVENNPDDRLQYLLYPDFDIWNYLTVKWPAKDFNWRTRRYESIIQEDTVGLDWKDDHVAIYKGFGIYILNKFKDCLTSESIELLNKDIFAESELLEKFDFSNLYEHQERWIKELLKYRRGIMQTPTSSGKTEIIARMAIEFLKQGRTVLITAGGGKVVEEIQTRIEERNSELNLPAYWDSNSKINVIYPNGFANSHTFNPDDKFFDEVSIVIADEVEGSVSDSAWAVYQSIKNPACYWYSFSATAEKETAGRLDIRENLSCIKGESSIYVIDLFGMSYVFEKPINFQIDLIEVSHKGLRAISQDIIEENFSDTSVYRDITNYIFSHREYLRCIDYILKMYGKLFIPINNLEFIELLIERYSDKYKIGTITGEGYWSSDEGMVSLERLKELIAENKIQLLLTSSSGFKGIDFRGMPNALVTLGTKASTVIQYIGRVARQNKFKVFVITPGGQWKLPIYSKHISTQLKLITDYYENCEINYREEAI